MHCCGRNTINTVDDSPSVVVDRGRLDVSDEALAAADDDDDDDDDDDEGADTKDEYALAPAANAALRGSSNTAPVLKPFGRPLNPALNALTEYSAAISMTLLDDCLDLECSSFNSLSRCKILVEGLFFIGLDITTASTLTNNFSPSAVITRMVGLEFKNLLTNFPLDLCLLNNSSFGYCSFKNGCSAKASTCSTSSSLTNNSISVLMGSMSCPRTNVFVSVTNAISFFCCLYSGSCNCISMIE